LTHAHLWPISEINHLTSANQNIHILQPNVSVIHIAGSNGKGSVALKTANTLQSKYKVGLFVSPHISSFRERIQVNGTPVSEDQVVQYLSEIFELCETHQIPATFFEVTTALAFRVFAAEQVDIVVLETGLGGRLDATNVIRHPALSVITSIGLEHTRILGDTIEQIATEKAGIIKEGCPVLIGPNVPLDVVTTIAAEKRSAEVCRCEDLLGVDTLKPSTTEVQDYDVENSRMSKAALILLQFHLAEKSVAKGEQPQVFTHDEMEEGVKIRPPCRFEEMDITVSISEEKSKVVRVILDVAHNPQAMEYLIMKLANTYPNLDPAKDVRMVVGMSADKDLKQCTDTLLKYLGGDASKLHLVAASHPRAASVDKILEANPVLKGAHYSECNNDEVQSSSVAMQVRQALTLAAVNTELLIVCGSVFIMADAREELGIIEPRDSAVIAEVAGAGLRSSQENFGEQTGKN
jgi:dihydrofolate synthase/folylpolyglutamate synthase